MMDTAPLLVVQQSYSQFMTQNSHDSTGHPITVEIRSCQHSQQTAGEQGTCISSPQLFLHTPLQQNDTMLDSNKWMQAEDQQLFVSTSE
jgi:hypothetical protein